MKSVLVIFNGIKFPYYLMEYSLEKAKQLSASLHALFLKAAEETEQGYGFPSDISQVEIYTDSDEALKDDKRIIKHNMKLAGDMAAAENIPFTSDLRTNSALPEIVKIVNGFDMVCIDAGYDGESAAMLTNDRFTLNELMDKASSSVQLVSEKEV